MRPTKRAYCAPCRQRTPQTQRASGAWVCDGCGAVPPAAGRGDVVDRECNDAVCGWRGPETDCVTPTHVPEMILCPECQETTEIVTPHAALLTALHAVTPQAVAQLSTGQVALVRGMLRDYGLIEKGEEA